jgi:hypothetical protein
MTTVTQVTTIVTFMLPDIHIIRTVTGPNMANSNLLILAILGQYINRSHPGLWASGLGGGWYEIMFLVAFVVDCAKGRSEKK